MCEQAFAAPMSNNRTNSYYVAVRRPDCRFGRFGSLFSPMKGKRRIDDAGRVASQFEDYCEAHPRSPAAVRRPRLTRRGAMWVALLGDDVQNGIVGLGSTIDSALRAFDVQYLNTLRPPIAA